MLPIGGDESRGEDLSARIVGDILLLHRAESLIDQGEGESYDDDEQGCVADGIDVVLSIDHSALSLEDAGMRIRLRRRLMLTCTTHQSMKGAKQFMSSTESMAPSGKPVL